MYKILIVDDDPDVLETIKLVLEIGGYDVLALEDGLNIFDKIKLFRPDLILLDIVIGQIDGRAICEKIKLEPTTQRLPVLMMSGLYKVKEVFAGKNGPDDFISKPFEMDVLIEKITKLIANKKAIDYHIN